MGGAGTYPLTIVGEDGTLVEFGNSEIVLECDSCESTGYSYFNLDIDCSELESTLCCALPSEESAISIPWTAYFYDNCDEVIGTESGTMLAWGEACVLTLSGDNSFTTPDMVEHEIFCDCLNP